MTSLCRLAKETAYLADAKARWWNSAATHLPGSHPSCSRAEGAIKASEAAQSDATTKLQKLDEEVRQLRDALSSAQQRATAAEARVELLQEAVRKAEERAARLEMAAASRAAAGGSGDAAGDGAAAAADGSREAQLAAEVKLLREELAAAQVGAFGWQSGCRVCGCVACDLYHLSIRTNHTSGTAWAASALYRSMLLPPPHFSSQQETAAAATGHAKQFEMLAKTSEEALKSVQADHERFKQEAAAR